MAATVSKIHTGNLLLDALGEDDHTRLLSGAEKRSIDIGMQLVYPGAPIERVFFPTSGTLSLLATPDDGQRVEAATIGREGAGDVFAALGSRTAIHELIGQVPGEMIVLDAETVVEAASSPGAFQKLVFGYIQAFFAQTSYSVACNAVHHVDQRAARWLLMTHDRVDGDTFSLKQEFLALMLGVQRPTVTLAAGALRNAGLIQYARGNVTVLDRDGLEQATCPCYEYIRLAYSRLVML
jgi:CRP-like cAMP-binding protein